MESCGHPRFPLCHSGVRRYAADLLAICVLIPDNFRLVSMLPLQIFKCPNTARPAGLRHVVLLQRPAVWVVLAAPAAASAQAPAEPDTAPGPQPPLTPLLQQLT
ncbi:MAG: hypothetical protein ACK5ES_03020, partial [Planctomyces sp.]